MSSEGSSLVALERIAKIYRMGEMTVSALDGVSLRVPTAWLRRTLELDDSSGKAA